VLRIRDLLAWVGRHSATATLAVTVAGLGVGGGLHLTGNPDAGDDAWLAVSICGVGYAALAMIDSLRKRRTGVDLIALLALGGAIAVGELLAAAVITVMLASGRALESWAAGRARRDLTGLLRRVPRSARCYRNGLLQPVPLDELVPGDLIMVAHGDVVPVDGTITTDRAVLDEAALTGEPVPVERLNGAPVRSGVVNVDGPFDMLASAKAEDSTYAGIARLVLAAEQSKAPFVRMADRYAIWFLLVTLAVAGSVALAAGADRAVAVLVVATPCPLILAAPVALVSGMSVAARRGVIVKGGGVLEKLARCTTLLLDKTGTLTSGHPAVAATMAADQWRPDEVLRLAASLDQVSSHVLAAAVVSAAQSRSVAPSRPKDAEEVAGQGIRGVVDGHRVAIGKAAWCGVGAGADAPRWVKAARRRARLDGALTVFVAIDDKPAGVLIMDDPVRPDAGRTIRALRTGGIDRIVMVTGDRAEVAETVGAIIGVDAVLAERTPPEKLDAVRAEQARGPVVMVGDGINDAPALTLADVGIALGVRGATASSQAADAVLTVDRIDPLGGVMSVARRTRRIAVQSVLAGMAMSLVAMGAAAAGLLPAVWGALLQEGIDVAVILNALRALRPGPAANHLAPADLALARRFRHEHDKIRPQIDELRTVADALGFTTPDDAIVSVRRAHRILVDEIEPHEQAEERELYPAVDRMLGSAEATSTMSRGHAEITRQVRRLGRFLDEIGSGSPDDADIADLRALLYGLHAVLRLHTAQEDESFLCLADDLDGDKVHARASVAPGD
jgi:heavy metal translocating P-type ATPase